MRVMIVLNASWNIVNFRMGLLRALESDGHEIIAVAPRDAYTHLIPFPFHEIPMRPRGLNPFVEFRLFWRLFRLYRKWMPHIVLHFTPKPNIYGSLAAGLLGIPAISNVAGLGSVFTGNSTIRVVMEFLYLIALRSNRSVFFQNREDMQLFLAHGLVKEDRVRCIPGSGIDLAKFHPTIESRREKTFCFLLVSRMLWEKGVGDFVEVSKIFKQRGFSARFQLLGFLEEKNAAAVDRAQMNAWTQAGWVEYLGESTDVRNEMGQVDCIVLPSTYREGVPRTLLEAAAMAKPIVAYDNVGVRDVVENGRNGFLIPPRDVDALAEAMIRMASLPSEKLIAFGLAGREKMKKEFDEKFVIEAYRSVLPKSQSQIISETQLQIS